MSFGLACIYSVMGMIVVFFALYLLMLIIRLMTWSGERAEKKAAAAEVQMPDPTVPVTEPIYAPGSAGELKLYDTDPRTAAMLMAIVADELQVPLNELRFLSIREIKETENM